MSVIIQQFLEKITVSVEDTSDNITVVVSLAESSGPGPGPGLGDLILNGSISGFWLGTQDEYDNVLPQQYKDDPKFVTFVREG